METKKCSKCGEEKSLGEFYKRERGWLMSFCKKCFNAYTVQRWIQRKKDAVSYKGGKCQHCGYDGHYAVLQFHHRDPKQKDCNWQKLRLKSWDKITAELDKCDLLCANCHILEHVRLREEEK